MADVEVDVELTLQGGEVRKVGDDTSRGRRSKDGPE
jgi:hypothetical protein